MSLSIRGSTRIISEFFEYSINSILYQRGIYPPEDFHTVKKYDLNLLVTHDEELKSYIRKILLQVHRWLLGSKCNKLVLVIIDKDEGDILERWEFNVEITNNPNDTNTDSNNNEEIPLEVTQKEIRGLIRQITASVTFLPELDHDEKEYTFNVLAYTKANAKVPLDWGDSSSKEIEQGESVSFKQFHTNDYKVGAQVTYKYR
ncbi:probable Mitotic spindle checkpoint component MAD2 [Saccharomycodes ludwigii]|uniref:Probable Mitotic spindle checkpoint component MAD2 n=1 Tax=Saccharomycodes ludwigii TaxID=36035 RepID=A0A376B3F3_9ASCO|nr:hypothetical protein SCDLUD_004781 [Saccharomycodes ludwigii]KAH3899342.1 hypothetical protein SCDLUD_004781 [Saccharomycodes ludwigii]SSD59119.1 probable Mitotic spindle checkpoint component MAD2 [Saccharomycodes ludwigii]